MDEETKKNTRQMMQKNDNAPCNNQPIRAKDQAKKKNGYKKGKTRRRKLCQETGLPLHSMHLSIIPARYPIRVPNRQIVHSLIRVAFQCIPCRGQIQPPFPLLINLINVGAVHELNSCGSCVGWEVG